jgi:membrane associated rhomboid family serine protease
MTGILVALNVAVFALWRTLGRSPEWRAFLLSNFLVSVDSLGRPWTLLLAEFSHIDPTHLLFNMIALWTFGRAVESALGPRRLLALYGAGGVLASLGHVVYGLAVGSDAPALGASGAVSAIAVVFAAMFPRARLYLNFFIPLPAALAVGLFLVVDLLGVLNPTGDMIAHAAHLGGALYGFLYWLIAIRPVLRRYRPVIESVP